MGAVPRPIGITILALLGFLEGVITLVIGLVLIAAASTITSILNQLGLTGITGLTGSFVSLAFAIVGAFVLVAALIVLLINWGLWTGKNWARWLYIIIAVLGLLSALAGLTTAVASNVFWLVVDILIIYYLTRPGVASYFKRMPMQPTTPPPPAK